MFEINRFYNIMQYSIFDENLRQYSIFDEKYQYEQLLDYGIKIIN